MTNFMSFYRLQLSCDLFLPCVGSQEQSVDRPLVHCHGDSAPCLVAGLHYQDQDSGLGTSLEVATYFQLMNYMTCIIYTYHE